MFTTTDLMGIEWQIDDAAVHRLINGYAYSAAFLQHAKLVRTEDHWLQKLNLASDNAQIDFDSAAIVQTKEKIAAQTADLFLCKLRFSGYEALKLITQLIAEKEKSSCRQNRLFQSAHDINNANIRWAERRMGQAKFVRNASVASLGVIATVASGGSTAFFLAAGGATAGKGVATYQDTGSASKAVGAAGLQALTLGAGNVVKGTKAVKAAVTLVIDTGAEAAESYFINENDLDRALKNAAIVGALGLGDRLFADHLKSVIGKTLTKGLDTYNLRGSKMLNVTNAPMAFGFQVPAISGAASPGGVGNRTAALLFGAGMKTGEETLKSQLEGMGKAPVQGEPATSCGAPDPSAARMEAMSRYIVPTDIKVFQLLHSTAAPLG